MGRPREGCCDVFTLTTKARLLNAVWLHMVILFVVFQNFLYQRWTHLGDPSIPLPPFSSPLSIIGTQVIPSLEHALMYLLLWSMIVLPLSMMHYAANLLSGTWLARWLPLSHLVEFHSLVGMHMLGQTVFVTALFFAWLGANCWGLLEIEGSPPGVDFCTDVSIWPRVRGAALHDPLTTFPPPNCLPPRPPPGCRTTSSPAAQ